MPHRRTRLLALAGASLLIAVPGAAQEADAAAGKSAPIRARPDSEPVQIVYSDALQCAAFDGFFAVILKDQPEALDQAEYYGKVGDLWLDAMIRSDPDARDTTLSDFKEAATALVLEYKADMEANGSAKAIGNLYDKHGENCMLLEKGIFGFEEPIAAAK